MFTVQVYCVWLSLSSGTIRAKLFFDGYRERHAAADILKAVAEIK